MDETAQSAVGERLLADSMTCKAHTQMWLQKQTVGTRRKLEKEVSRSSGGDVHLATDGERHQILEHKGEAVPLALPEVDLIPMNLDTST